MTSWKWLIHEWSPRILALIIFLVFVLALAAAASWAYWNLFVEPLFELVTNLHRHPDAPKLDL